MAYASTGAEYYALQVKFTAPYPGAKFFVRAESSVEQVADAELEEEPLSATISLFSAHVPCLPGDDYEVTRHLLSLGRDNRKTIPRSVLSGPSTLTRVPGGKLNSEPGETLVANFTDKDFRQLVANHTAPLAPGTRFINWKHPL